MPEYFDTLESFYNEKLKFLTKKDKYTQCNACPENKEFVETNNELIISCGSDDNSSCGKQIQIVLPEYIHYSSKLDELEKELEQEINWDVINKYTDVNKYKLELPQSTLSSTSESPSPSPSLSLRPSPGLSLSLMLSLIRFRRV